MPAAVVAGISHVRLLRLPGAGGKGFAKGEVTGNDLGEADDPESLGDGGARGRESQPAAMALRGVMSGDEGIDAAGVHEGDAAEIHHRHLSGSAIGGQGIQQLWSAVEIDLAARRGREHASGLAEQGP